VANKHNAAAAARLRTTSNVKRLDISNHREKREERLPTVSDPIDGSLLTVV
jgi:hypothetical protein